jgi:hypothetical protein
MTSQISSEERITVNRFEKYLIKRIRDNKYPALPGNINAVLHLIGNRRGQDINGLKNMVLARSQTKFGTNDLGCFNDPVYEKLNFFDFYGGDVPKDFRTYFDNIKRYYRFQLEDRQMPQATYEWLLNTSLESLKVRFWMEYKAQIKEKAEGVSE